MTHFIILMLHIAAGILALLFFAIPLVTHKGGQAHIGAGRAYLLAMVVVAFSAFVLCTHRLLDDASSAAQTNMAWLLIFISILALAAGWFGVRVLRFKNRKTRHQRPIDLILPAILSVSALAIGWYGWIQENTLLTLFSVVGVVVGAKQLHYWLTPPTETMHWWYAHMAGMITCCIATVTAFLVTAVPRLLGWDHTPILLWFAPALIMGGLLEVWTKRYKKQFNRSPRK